MPVKAALPVPCNGPETDYRTLDSRLYDGKKRTVQDTGIDRIW